MLLIALERKYFQQKAEGVREHCFGFRGPIFNNHAMQEAALGIEFS